MRTVVATRSPRRQAKCDGASAQTELTHPASCTHETQGSGCAQMTHTSIY